MSGIPAIGAVQSRVASIESRLGVAGARGTDVRGTRSDDFEAVLGSSVARAAAGSSTPTPWSSTLATTTSTDALQVLADRLGIALPATTGSGPLGATAGRSTGSLPASVPFASLFEAAGAAHGVDPALLAAVAGAESGYDPTAVSHAGAQGLMQLMPGTAKGLGVTDAFDPAQAVDGAARLLAGHLDWSLQAL